MTTTTMQILAAYLHVLGVATYLGGAIVMEFVVGPAQKAIPPAQAQVMGLKTADRFLAFAWGALGLILASGLLRLATLHNLGLLASARLWQTSYGRTLLAMVILWAVLVVNGAIITFVLRPKLAGRMSSRVSAAQASAGQDAKIKAAAWTARLARVDLGIVLVVALLGSSLKFGGVG